MTKTNVTEHRDIQDIPAQTIKDLMLEHQFENPTETAMSIASTAFTFTKLLGSSEYVVDGASVVNAFADLERMFNFYLELGDHLNTLKH